jgi:hypothetical protein
MVANEFPGWILVVFGLGAGLLFSGFKRFRIRRQIEDMPTSRIATAAQGLVEFQGFANSVASDYAKSIDQTPVACSYLEIEEYVNKGKKGSEWEVRYRGFLVDRFLVTDESGSAWVLARESDLRIEPRIRGYHELSESTLSHLLENVLPKLGGIGFSMKEWAGSGLGGSILKAFFGQLRHDHWRVSEKNIEIGQPVYVLGQFKTRALEKTVGVFKDFTGKVYEIAPKGGVMSVSGNPFVVSNRHQNELLAKIDHGIKMMIGGAAIISIAAYLWVDSGYLLRHFN